MLNKINFKIAFCVVMVLNAILLIVNGLTVAIRELGNLEFLG